MKLKPGWSSIDITANIEIAPCKHAARRVMQS
jgi:hypothetical protein